MFNSVHLLPNSTRKEIENISLRKNTSTTFPFLLHFDLCFYFTLLIVLLSTTIESLKQKILLIKVLNLRYPSYVRFARSFALLI